MTERHPMAPGRADLRAFDSSGEFAEVADRIIAPAIARFVATRRTGFASTLRGLAAPMLAAAAVVMAIGIGALAIVTDAPRPGVPAELLAQWMEAEHVPTNGELLFAFQGYGR
jgi:hypothetical protein